MAIDAVKSAGIEGVTPPLTPQQKEDYLKNYAMQSMMFQESLELSDDEEDEE